MIVLRSQQATVVEAIREAYRAGKRAPLLVAPCGFGKTVVFSYIAANSTARGNTVYILAHRAELLDQISEMLPRFEVSHGFIAAGHERTDAPVQVCSVQTLIRRDAPEPHLIVIDECHHATAGNIIGKILARYPRARRLGVTATPTRLSGEGLGDCFDALILGPTTKELTDLGLLARARVFAPTQPDLSGVHVRSGDYVQSEALAVMDKPSITGDAISHYQRLASGRPFVAFCLSIKHATEIAASFRSAGINAVEIHGRMDERTRREIVSDFRRGAITGLCSVDLISEGFDVPGIHVGIMLRPTASLGLWRQQVGRVLRTAPGKENAIVLDHAGNTLRHGLPDDDIEWTLEGRTRRVSRAETAPVRVKVCPSCFAANSTYRRTCVDCGIEFPVASREVPERAGDLEEITERQNRRAEQAQAKTLSELIEVGRRRGYANAGYWAQKIWESRRKRA